MTERPITPTRIIPAGAPLPARPPEPDELPPWRTPPPPAPPTAAASPPPGPIEVRIVFDPYIEPEPEPEPWWTRITRIARPWKIGAALAIAVIPIPGVGHSLGSVWAYTVSEARTDVGIPWAYGLALAPLAIGVRLVTRHGSLRGLTICAISLIGLTGAADWYDPILALTGVHPR